MSDKDKEKLISDAKLDAEKTMNTIGCNGFYVGQIVISNGEPVVNVFFPKKGNSDAIKKLGSNKSFRRSDGIKKDGVLYCRYEFYSKQSK